MVGLGGPWLRFLMSRDALLGVGKDKDRGDFVRVLDVPMRPRPRRALGGDGLPGRQQLEKMCVWPQSAQPYVRWSLHVAVEMEGWASRLCQCPRLRCLAVVPVFASWHASRKPFGLGGWCACWDEPMAAGLPGRWAQRLAAICGAVMQCVIPDWGPDGCVSYDAREPSSPASATSPALWRQCRR